jgi:preprotein translocase subunit YajC
MQTADWIQLAGTALTMVIALVVFYFKSQQAVQKEIADSQSSLRKDITESEGRLRGAIDSLRGDVHRIDVTVARLEERVSGRRAETSPAE